MANMNDQRILELKKQIEIKKAKLSESIKFTPITNCSLELDKSNRVNIRVLNDRKDIIELLVKLNSLRLSAKDLKLESEYLIGGYMVEDWIIDLGARLDIISRKNEESKLKVMEEQLTKLLSEDKKVELEIENIAALLEE